MELENRLTNLIEHRLLHELRDELMKQPPADIAELVAHLPVSEGIVVFRILPRDLAADIFEFLPTDVQATLLNSLGDKRVEILLNEMAADDRTALFEEIPAIAAKKLLNLLSREERGVALNLLGYPEHSVGRLMTPDYVALRPEWDMPKVFAHIRQYGKEIDSLNVLYVLDDRSRLVSEVRIREILFADPTALVFDIMSDTVVSLRAADDQEVAVLAFKKYSRTMLPVIDSQGLLIGIVTVDDVLAIAEEEATEDIQKLGGSEALNEPYIKASFSTLVRSRASWLVFLFIGEMFTATAMGYFEGEIQRAVVLALFVPLIISSGGNAGSQAATLVIRALSIGEITLRDWRRVFFREVSSGLILGLILGSIGLLRVCLWAQILHMYGEHWFAVGLTVFGAIIGVVLWGTTCGAMLPFALKRLGFDPATSSAPFIATLVDVVGLVIYFSVASVILKGLLL
jgi:magnesium transporter